jgi:hypothetical protein
MRKGLRQLPQPFFVFCDRNTGLLWGGGLLSPLLHAKIPYIHKKDL